MLINILKLLNIFNNNKCETIQHWKNKKKNLNKDEYKSITIGF